MIPRTKHTSGASCRLDDDEHNPLVASALYNWLREGDKVTFADLMATALYHPTGGYYANTEYLPGRDYRTSPQVHPAFAVLVALQLEQMWRVLGFPALFTVVEAGAGGGELCHDVLCFSRRLEPAFVAALRYVVVEPRGVWQNRQRQTLPADLLSHVRWVSGSALAFPLGNVCGCIISNELIDSFPVHRVVNHQGRLRELYLVEQEGAVVEVLDEPSTPALERYFERLGLRPPEDALVEVNLAALQFVQEAASSLTRGFVLTFDYGLAAEDLYSIRRPLGTIRSYHRHVQESDPYRRLGRQDITTHVDFTMLDLAGRDAGLHFSGLTTQRDFLINLGWDWLVDGLNDPDLPDSRRYENLFALRELIAVAGLGGFKVLAQHKGLHDPALDGFNSCNSLRRSLLAGGRRLVPALL